MRFFRLLGLVSALAYLWACSAYAAYDPLGPNVGTALQLPAAGAGSVRLVNSPTTYGAKCDGVTDDSTALASWAASLTGGIAGYIPGNCLFKTAFSFPTSNGTTIYGDGINSKLTYAGANTTNNVVTLGGTNTACTSTGWTLSNFQMVSTTIMTGGDALHVNGLCQVLINNIDIGGGSRGNSNFYNGIHFVGGNTVYMIGYQFRASNIAEIVNGWSSNQFTDMFQSHGTVVGATVGINIAGNVGGFNIMNSDVLTNGTNYLIDQSQVGSPNLQVFFGPNTNSDVTTGGAGIGININDAGGSLSTLWFSGTWVASAGTGVAGKCLYAQSGVTWKITMTGGTVYNCQGDGIRNDSVNTVWNITGTTIRNNGAWGINNTVSNTNISINNVFFASNSSGNFTGTNVNSYTVDGQGSVLGGNVIVNDTAASSNADLTVQATSNSSGANIKLIGNGGVTPNKTIRSNGGVFQIVNSAYASVLLALTDAGALQVSGLPTSAGGGGLYVCVDTSGNFYKKSSCP